MKEELPNMEALKAIFDKCMAAVSQDDLDGASKYFLEEVNKAEQEAIKNPETRAQYLQMAKAMVPISCKADSVDVDGDNLTLHMSGTFNDIFEPGKISAQEMDIDFKQESGEWKMGKIAVHDPHMEEVLNKSADQSVEENSEYDSSSTISLSGAIDSVKFEEDHTLVVMKMFDEEDLIYLPKKAELGKFGLEAGQLVAGAFLQVQGNKHKTNKFKILAFKAELS